MKNMMYEMSIKKMFLYSNIKAEFLMECNFLSYIKLLVKSLSFEKVKIALYLIQKMIKYKINIFLIADDTLQS